MMTMKRILILFTALFAAGSVFAQSEYNLRRRTLFEVLPVLSSDIVFLGNSITDGCEWAELDVQMTRDGVGMVTHDTSLRRCTGRNENIYDLTYNEVRELDAGRWFHRQFTGSYIPTLEEVLALCKGKAELNIEIKPSTFTPTLEAETVRLIHAYDYGADCVVTSQSYETLCKVKELDPDITTGYILALGVGTYYDLPAADFFSVESTFITAGMVQQIHLRGKTISAWTINRQQDAEKLLQLGVDDLITDKPEIIAPLLARDKALDNRLLWLRDQIQELLAAPDAEEAMEVEETTVSLAFCCSSGMESAPQLHMVLLTLYRVVWTPSARGPA